MRFSRISSNVYNILKMRIPHFLSHIVVIFKISLSMRLSHVNPNNADNMVKKYLDALWF